MIRESMTGLGLGLVFSFGLLPPHRGQEAARPAVPSVRRGVALAGAEFGTDRPGFCNDSPGVVGKDYTYNREFIVRSFCEKGVRLLRLPFRWERIQPRLGEPLDAEELARLKKAVARAHKHGGEVLLDVHNYGRYVLRRGDAIVPAVIDESFDGTVPVRREHFADLWRRLSQEFAADPGVWAYGLMNEPHDMGKSSWKAISQAAVDAIRASGDDKLVVVSGDGWSAAHRFQEANGPRPWISDPANNVAYEAHCYFDHDHSGHYALDYETESARDPHLEGRGMARVSPFVGWCKVNGVRGFLGEYGVPRDDPRWQRVLAGFLEALDRAGMDSCAWAAGEWCGDDRLAVTPSSWGR